MRMHNLLFVPHHANSLEQSKESNLCLCCLAPLSRDREFKTRESVFTLPFTLSTWPQTLLSAAMFF